MRICACSAASALARGALPVAHDTAGLRPRPARATGIDTIVLTTGWRHAAAGQGGAPGSDAVAGRRKHPGERGPVPGPHPPPPPGPLAARAELARLARGLLESICYTLRTFKHSGADGADADIDYVEERKVPDPFAVYGSGRRTGARGVCAANVGRTVVTAGSSCGSCRHSGRRSTARGASADRASRVTPSIATSPSEQHAARQQALSGGAGADQARAAPARDQVAFQTSGRAGSRGRRGRGSYCGRVRRAEDVQRTRRRRAHQAPAAARTEATRAASFRGRGRRDARAASHRTATRGTIDAA